LWICAAIAPCKKIRRQLRQAQFDQPPVVIDQSILDGVLTDLQISYAEILGQNDFDLLKGMTFKD